MEVQPIVTEDISRGALIGIGELARRTGLPVRTIRFYSDEGILDSRRSAGGHRMFDADGASRRLRLIRQLRALGLGLASIAEILRGDRSIAEVVAAESARLDIEFRSLAWRRAALRALRAADPPERTRRLALLASAQDGGVAHDHLIRFWRRVLTGLARLEFDTFVCANVPRPPEAPSVEEVVNYAELTGLATDPDLSTVMSRQLWRTRPQAIRNRRGLFYAVGDVLVDVLPLVSQGIAPRTGGELDRYVEAHATARGEHDTSDFRAQLLTDATDTDPRLRRYWTLTAELITTPTAGQPHYWLFEALHRSDCYRGS
ncbi:MerR-like DNA binding protein [Nocardia pseudobrasiliensis]|uniref:MerR-like DNA binding protein n=1 Tax=Nocardia pseudobrasiliensis TaxID=45979 RepID=A0A370IHY7_9NOCA|nr:MerR-like DNA binding protein [Nocardia pseudobrasiliensis]